MLRLAVLSAIVALCAADCYMHCPRGSNNRLNEASANRNNGNRCFDSQNNNRGGYNVGDLDAQQGFDGNSADYFQEFGEGFTQGFFTGQQDGTARYEYSSTRYGYAAADMTSQNPTTGTGSPSGANTMRKQTESYFWESSFMAVTWTIQHGSGANPKLYSQFIAQYAVENMRNSATLERTNTNNLAINAANGALRGTATTNDARYSLMRRLGLRLMLQNGRNTNTPTAQTSTDMGQLNNAFQANAKNDFRCQHESNEWYSLCHNRNRNNGLFTADQKVQANRATHTRQNPNGNRRGLECAEERDYYPYWRPTPFVDVAILTGDVADCNARLKPESQNTRMKYACTQGPTPTTGNAYDIPTTAAIIDAFNKTECDAAQGIWEGFSWNLGATGAPMCLKLPHSQVNHLGNMVTGSISGQAAGGSQSYFMWKLPRYADLIDTGKIGGQPHFFKVLKMRQLMTGDVATTAATDSFTRECVRMIFRVRYNMSTTDYDPYNTNATMNDKPNSGVISPIKQNPTVEMGVLNQGLRLAINTAQTGRTFQDRSHTFLVCKRPAGSALGNRDILNVQVQGKRGNIVQTFPATEYQFSPRQWTLCPGKVFHFQWAGSNTHNNGNPAGDGQAGDAGEGRGGSDRSALTLMLNMQASYPAALDTISAADNFWNHVNCYHGVSLDPYTTAEAAAIAAGTSGYYHSRAYAMKMHTATGATTNDRLQVLFNNAAASYRGGIVCTAKGSLPTGREYAFMCTRNNNFTNRAQKMKILTAATCSYAQNTAVDGIGSLNALMMLG